MKGSGNRKYRVKKAFRSPSIKPNSQGKVDYKSFVEGDEIEGYVRKQDGQGFSLVPQIVVDNRWAIPLRHLERIKTMNVDGGQKKNISEETAELNKKIKETANQRTLTNIIKYSKGSISGGLIGLALGVVLGLYLKKNLWISGTIGAIAGGVTGNFISRQTNSKKSDKSEEKEKSEEKIDGKNEEKTDNEQNR